ncbi:MAG: hypothetical protein K2J80_11135 [Oscillospiraceae bacterium]|nr:hypothetical protein [Oscillospiraceae bacterium]
MALTRSESSFGLTDAAVGAMSGLPSRFSGKDVRAEVSFGAGWCSECEGSLAWQTAQNSANVELASALTGSESSFGLTDAVGGAQGLPASTALQYDFCAFYGGGEFAFLVVFSDSQLT